MKNWQTEKLSEPNLDPTANDTPAFDLSRLFSSFYAQ